MSNAPAHIGLSSLEVTRAVNSSIQEFSKILLERISQYKGLSGLWVEFEMRLGKHEDRRFTSGVRYEEFSRFYTYLEENYKKVDMRTDLTINNAVPNHDGKPVRMTISGAPNIMKYCTTNEVDWASVQFQIKSSILGLENPLDLDDYDIRLSSAMEKDLSLEEVLRNSRAKDMDELQSMIQSADKQFRYKQRVSYLSPDGLFRYDLTQTKQVYDGRNIRKDRSLAESDLFAQQPTYEVEVELLHGDKPVEKQTKESFTDVILYHLTNMMQIRSDAELVLTKSKKIDVLQDFLRLYLGKQDISREFSEYYMRPDKQYHKMFPGAKVSTLEIDNIVPEKKKTYIFDNYTVTDKADGERFILYIDPKHRVYLINDRMEVLRTDLVLPAANGVDSTMLDGEMVATMEKGVKVYNFYVFDALFDHRTRVYDSPLLKGDDEKQPCRWDTVERVVAAIGGAPAPTIRGVSFIRVGAKTLRSISGVQPAAMKQHCAWIWNHRHNGFPYELDGLIFTPKFEAYPIGKSWASALKWKPPEENSIDFLVRFRTGAGAFTVVAEGDKTTKYQSADLYVGDTKTSDRGGRDFKEYVEKRFDVPHTMGKDPSYLIRIPVGSTGTKDEVVVRNDTIVECVWNDGWKVLRTRLDKTQRYLASGKKISGTANNMGVAISIWSTIVHPITTEMITGAVSIPEKKSEYYSKSGTSLTEPVRAFNNYMKSLLLNGAKRSGTSLIDFSCGRGGDLKKWYNSGYTRVVGLDYSKQGIENMDPAIGAYGRIDQMKKGNPAFARWVDGVKLFWADTSKITTAAHPNGICGESQKAVAAVALTKPFDVGVSFFTAHYYFESPMKIRGFFQNLHDNIRKDGVAVVTCFDGEEIYKMLEDYEIGQPRNGTVRKKIPGTNVETTTVVWSIKKGYKKHTPFVPETSNTGLKIDIKFESISDEYYTEYLVHKDLFMKYANSYGFELVSDEEATSFGLTGGTGLFGDVITKLQTEGVETLNASELGRIFYKDIAELVNNDANIHLREWTKNNRYFMLRKKNDVEGAAAGWRSRLVGYDCQKDYDAEEAHVDFVDVPAPLAAVPEDKVLVLDQVSAADLAEAQVSAMAQAEASNAPAKKKIVRKPKATNASLAAAVAEAAVSTTELAQVSVSTEAVAEESAPVKKKIVRKPKPANASLAATEPSAALPEASVAVSTVAEAEVSAPPAPKLSRKKSSVSVAEAAPVSTEAVPVSTEAVPVSTEAAPVLAAAEAAKPKGKSNAKKNANSKPAMNVAEMLQAKATPVVVEAVASAPVAETVSEAQQLLEQAAPGAVVVIKKKALHRKKKEDPQ